MTALLLIDVQKALAPSDDGGRNNPDAETNIIKLLASWRAASQPVIHVKHDSVEPGSALRPELPGNKFHEGAEPINDEPLFVKSVNSAFIGTDLESYLHQHELNTLVIVGLTTDHCVSTSVRMASNLGFQVHLVSDATATFERVGPDGTHYSAQQMHDSHLASLNGEFCSVVNTTQAQSLMTK